MPTVAELDVQIDAHDDATATLVRLDALLKELDADKVNIDVEADTGAAASEVEALAAEIDSLSDETVTIELDTDGEGKIAELEAELKAIPDEKVTIEVDTDTDSARRGAADIDRLSSSALRASGQVNFLTAAVLGLGPALVPLGGVAAGGIAALASAFTVAGISAGLFGLVAVTAFKPVMAASKKMKTLQDQYNQAVTDKQREAAMAKMKALIESLTPAQRTMLDGINAFSDAWHQFASKFEPEIFQIAGEGLKGLAGLLPSLAPIVQGAADAFLDLERSAIRALNGPFWQDFISMIGSSARPILEGLGRSIGNIIKGFAGLVSAFMPLTLDFTGGLEAMTGRFADWSAGLKDNKGFQDFVQYVRDNTPLVLDFLGSFVQGFVDLVQAAAPVGAAILTVIGGLLDFFGALQDSHPALATALVAFVGFGAVFTNMLGPLIAIGRLVGVLVSGIGALVEGTGIISGIFIGFVGVLGGAFGALAAIAAIIAIVAGAVVIAYLKFQTFHDWVDKVAGKIVDALQGAMDWLASTFGPAVQAVIDFVTGQFDKIVAWADENSGTFQQAWDNIITVLSFVWDVIKAIFEVGGAAISAIWTAIWPTLAAIVRGAWDIIKGIVSGAVDIILGIILVFAALLAGDWGAMWDGIQQIAKGALEALVGIIMGTMEIIWALWKASWELIVAFAGLVWDGLAAAAGTAWAAIWAVISGAQQIIQGGIDAFWSGVLAFLGLVWNGLVAAATTTWTAITSVVSTFNNLILANISTIWNFILALVQTVATSIWNAVTAAWNGILNTIRTVMGLVASGLQAAWATITAIVTGAATAIWNVIVSIWNQILSSIRSAMSSIQSAVSSAFSAIASNVSGAMNAISSIVSAVWNSVVSTVRAAMSAFVSAVENGISRAVSAIGQFGSRALAAIGGLAGQFYSAGRNLIQNLIDGIRSMLGGLGNIMGSIASTLGGVLPGSPAEYGPLSGQGWSQIRGQHFVEDLISGIGSQTNGLNRTMADIADLMTLDANSGAAFDAIANGASAGSGTGSINITVEEGAIQITIPEGVDPKEVRTAFDGAGDQFADQLLTALRRQ